MLGVRFCARAFSTCGERGPLFIVVRGPLTIAASLVAEHKLQTRRLSSCGSQTHLLRGMWDLPRPGLEPVSPALAGRFPTIAPPGKPPDFFSIYLSNKYLMNINLWLKKHSKEEQFQHCLAKFWPCSLVITNISSHIYFCNILYLHP